MTIYADTYAALNFAVNYLILLSTAQVTGAVYSKLRVALGALAGAAYALLCGLWPRMDCILFKPAMAVLMVLTALGKRRLIKRTVLFFGASFAVGGGVWALYLMTGRQAAPAGVLLCAAVCNLVLKAGFRLAGGCVRGGCVRVEIWRQGRRVALNALVDTGNRLTGGQDNMPVLVCEKEAVLPLLTRAEQQILQPSLPLDTFAAWQSLGMKPRLLPFRTVTDTALMVAFLPDKVSWEKGQSDRVLIGISPGSLSSSGGFSAVAGSWIVEEGGVECLLC